MKKVLGRLRASTLLNKPVRAAIKKVSRFSKSITGQGIAHWPVAGTVDVAFEGLNFRMYSECDDSLAAALYYETDYVELFDLSFFNKLSRQSNCVLDVGANTGIYALTAALSNPEAKVFAFEPYYFNFDRLKKNCALNTLDNLVLLQKAVGETDGLIEFSIPKKPRIIDVASTNHEFSSRVYGKDVEWHQVEVDQICLDSFVRSLTSETRIDLIKIDVELHERQVFDGMKGVLTDHRPNILFESFVDRPRIEFFNAIAKQYDLTPYAVMRRGILRLDNGFIENPDGLNFFLSPVRSSRIYTAMNEIDGFVSEILAN